MELKRARNFEDVVNVEPITDEEFEELLNEMPNKGRNKTKKFKKGKRKNF
ncbi:MAG: hypothetical protein ACLFVX_01910 [Archaeoglobaceae archaeon]